MKKVENWLLGIGMILLIASLGSAAVATQQVMTKTAVAAIIVFILGILSINISLVIKYYEENK